MFRVAKGYFDKANEKLFQTLIYKSQRNFNFSRLTGHYEFRKKMKNDLEVLNKKTERQSWPFYKQIWFHIKNHKKKLIFFCIIGGIMQYKDGYWKIPRWFRKREPFLYKMRRWLLGEANIIPDSIKETWIEKEGFKIKKENIRILSNLFLKADRELFYGINRRFLVKLYSKVGMFQKKEKITEFYFQTPYGRRRNQKLSGVNLLGFLTMFDSFLKEARKNDPNLTEDQFLKTLVDNWENILSESKEWEKTIYSKREEYKNAYYALDEDKQKFLRQILSEDIFIDLKDLDLKSRRNGFYGLSYKDKIITLTHQIMSFTIMKQNYIDKISKSELQSKIEKMKKKVNDLESLIDTKNKELNQAKEDFKKMFPKVKLEDL